MDPPEGPLNQAPYNTPQDIASNPRSLVQVTERVVHPLVQRRSRNNRAHEEVAAGGDTVPPG